MKKHFKEPRVSRKNARGQKTKSPGFEVNNHWNICDLCGSAVRNKDSRLTWDGKVVCPDDWDYRHPQDFVRGRKDDQSPKGLTRPGNEFVAPAERNPVAPYTYSPITIAQVLNTTSNLVGVFALAGGESATITGAGFTEDMTLTIGTLPEVSYTFVDSSTITFTSPAFTRDGLFPLTLTRTDGEQAFYQLTIPLPVAPDPFVRLTYEEVVASFSPIVEYKLDETSGTTAVDSSGNGYDAEYINSPTQGNPSLIYGVEGTSILTDYAGSRYVQLSDVSGLPTDSDVSVVLWVTLQSNSGVVGRILAYDSDGSGSAHNTQWGLFLDTSNRLEYKHEYGTNADEVVETTWEPLALGETYCLGFSKDTAAKTVTLYINGLTAGQFTYTNETEGGSLSQLYLGSLLSVHLDYASVYGSALTDSDMLQHFLAGCTINPTKETLEPVAALKYTSSGTLTLTESSYVRVVAVGGGGAGGTFGGGGGAGGSVADVTFFADAGEYDVVVGAGAPSTGSSSPGASGGTSTFGTSLITAPGGLGGAQGTGGLGGGDTPSPDVRGYALAPVRQGSNIGAGSAAGAGAGAGEGFLGGYSVIGGDGVDLTSLPAFADHYGGGGGGSTSSGGGSGGSGGGGSGSTSTPTAGQDGLGGGGGGRWNSAGHPGTAGGAGTVLIFLETSSYSTTGSPAEVSL